MKCYIENGVLNLTFPKNGKERTVSFHDSVKFGGKRYFFFHDKTKITEEKGKISVKTSAIFPENGAPVPGLLANYTVTEKEEGGPFYVSLSFECDGIIKGCSVKPFDVTFGDFKPTHYTGYEYDADGEPYSKKFEMPPENPDTPSYEELLTIRPHVAWERMKTRAKTFRKALSLENKSEFMGVYGGSPTFNPEAGFVSVFTTFGEYYGDLRFYSGKNALGAWFIPEKEKDMFRLFDELDSARPELPEKNISPYADENVTLKSGDLTVSLKKSKTGIVIANVGRKKSDKGLIPLFDISVFDTYYNRGRVFDSGEGWKNVEVLKTEDFARFTFSEPDNGRVNGIRVVIEAFSDPGKSRISFKTKVLNTSDRWAVRGITYPSCPVLANGTVYTSIASGNEDDRFAEKSKISAQRYPTGVKAPMAYVAFYEKVPAEKLKKAKNGLYVGFHDPEGTMKDILVASAGASKEAFVSTIYHPDYESDVGNSFTLPGEEVWQVFSGDWFDAADIYRDFVMKSAEWFPHSRGRSDIPEWFRDTPVWIMHDLPIYNPDSPPFPVTLREKYADKSTDDWYEKAILFREKIGVPVTYHLYNWHWVPFNNDNPNYFPVIPGLREGMRKMKDAGIRMIPYIAGYSWDMHDKRGDDFRFGLEASDSTAKDSNGNIINKSYASCEPDGKAVQFARMCPSTSVWKKEISYIAKKLSDDYGADGIYLDVVSTAYEPCCDKNHLHAPGQGAFWHRAYSELISELRANVPSEFAVVSESVSEVYMDSLDGFLAWTWVYTGGVPAYMRVYAGYGQFFGRVFTSNKRDDIDYFRFNLAQSLCYGQQLGWIHPEIVDDKKQFPFLKKMAEIRYRYRKFFEKAYMLRPPFVSGGGKMDTEAFLRCQEYNHEKSVVSGAFEDDEKKVIITVNTGSKKAEFTLSFLDEEYGKIRKYELEKDGFEIVKKESAKGITTLHCKAESEGYGIIVIRK